MIQKRVGITIETATDMATHAMWYDGDPKLVDEAMNAAIAVFKRDNKSDSNDEASS